MKFKIYFHTNLYFNYNSIIFASNEFGWLEYIVWHSDANLGENYLSSAFLNKKHLIESTYLTNQDFNKYGNIFLIGYL